MHTEVVEITYVHTDCYAKCCGGFKQAKEQWKGDAASSGRLVEDGANCLVAVTKFIKLLQKLSNNKCKFSNGLCCIECSNINIYKVIHFTADKNKTALCYYCKCLILPNFKCLDCLISCDCQYHDDGGVGDFCGNFCCKDCAATKQIGGHWTAPACVIGDDD